MAPPKGKPPAATLHSKDQRQQNPKKRKDSPSGPFTNANKRFKPNTNNNHYTRPQQAKVRDARQIAAQTSRGAFRNGELDVDKFVKAREYEIQALESGISFDGPSGKVTIDPATHHVTLDIHIAEVKNRKMNVLAAFKQQKPADTAAVCNLQKNPNENKQFVIKI